MLILGKKVVTYLDSVLKSRDITFSTNVHLVNAMVFPMVMYGCASWTVKKVEPRRIDAFELWCWRTLESPLDCMEIQPVHPKGISPGCLLVELMLKLMLQCFGLLTGRPDSFGKDPVAGKDWGQGENGTTEDEIVGWHHWLSGHGFWWTPGFGDGQVGLACLSSWGFKESDTTDRLNWTEQ